MDQQLARTKVLPALRRVDTLARPRLLDRLTSQTKRRLTLIVAEAGYGKTTLLADFASRCAETCLWFKVDEHEGDWVTFSSYVVAAIREARPDFGDGTRALLGQMLMTDPPRALVIDTLVAEVAALDDLRAIFIVDDFHLVDRAPDAREIMGRLIKQAPAGLRFVIASRCPPELQRGRLVAQGEAATLTTDDLRFSRDETDSLFRDVYGQALEAELVDQIDRRTEGWAASLQLLGSSIRGSSAAEIRARVRSLSGAHGPLYDFLAEEVLSGLSPELRRFVIAASLLERITPRYVVALFEADDPAPDEEQAGAWISEADQLGLAGRHAPASPHRFHPLLRDFLLRQLHQSATPAAIRDTHRRVARRAEVDAWLIASHHYLEAGDVDDAIRVLTDSLLVTAGTGDWGPASNLLGRLPDEPGDPAAQVILALQEMHDQQMTRAMERLGAIPLSRLDPAARSMVRYALIRGAWLSGDGASALGQLRELVDDQEGPGLLRDIADAQIDMLTPGGRQLLSRSADKYRVLTRQLRDSGLHYFAGIALNNSMILAHARGSYVEAAALGTEALEQFERSGGGQGEVAETAAFLAGIELELGHRMAAEEYLDQALQSSDDPGALVGGAEVLITMGRRDEALTLFLRAQALGARVPHTPALRTDIALIGRRIDLASAHHGRDEGRGATPQTAPIGIGAGARALTFDATEALATGSPDAAELAREALATALADGATHWERRIRILDAVARGSDPDLRAAITDAARLSPMALPDVADAVVAVLDLLDPVPSEVEASIAAWPDRWLPLLRRRLEAGLDKRSLAAARLLSRFGTEADVPRLKAWERRHIRHTKGLRLGRQLAMRTSPKLLIHDLGTTRLERGTRTVGLTDVRRRAATLLMYLVARPGRVALREQVLEDIWPDLDPPAATNSLNQTLYFVRRDIEPGYDEAVSVNYVLYEGDLLQLEPELVRVDSWTFQEHATSKAARQASADECLAILETYDGPFAPVFAYEDWAIDWREQVHTSYLDLVTRTQLQLMDAGRVTEAIALTQRALAIDPKAIDLERSLVWLYSAAGSRSAAAEQYRHYAAAHREELGVEASSFHVLLGEGLTPPP